MAHKTKIGGTAYSIIGGKTKIGGTTYTINGGKTKVKGTVYDIKFGGNLISFYIHDIEYQAEEGMTWGEWADSEYDINNDWVKGTDYWGNAVIINSIDETLPENEIIKAGSVYTPSSDF